MIVKRDGRELHFFDDHECLLTKIVCKDEQTAEQKHKEMYPTTHVWDLLIENMHYNYNKDSDFDYRHKFIVFFCDNLKVHSLPDMPALKQFLRDRVVVDTSWVEIYNADGKKIACEAKVDYEFS